MKDRITIFKDKAFDLVVQYLQGIIDNCSYSVIASSFKLFDQFQFNEEAQKKLVIFVQQSWVTFVAYLSTKVGIVSSVPTEEDRARATIYEEILKILNSATLIDYRFLLGEGEQGEQGFLAFLQFLD